MKFFKNFTFIKQTKSSNQQKLQQDAMIILDQYNTLQYQASTLYSTIINNPYQYKINTLQELINKISVFAGSIDYTIENDKGEEITSIVIQPIVDLLARPSIRQQTFTQLIQDSMDEYIFNNKMYLQFDLNSQQLTILKSYEINFETLNEDTIPLSIKIRRYCNTEYFNFDTENLYFINSDNTKIIFFSELVSEEVLTENDNRITTTTIKYAKNILHKIWQYVYLEYLILNKNSFLAMNKNEANLLVGYLKNNEILTKDHEDIIRNNLKSSVEQIKNNGTTNVMFSNKEIGLDKININNEVFDTQFKDLLDDIRRKMYNYLEVPPERGLEQSKYTNNVSSDLYFLDYAVKPKLNFIYNFLSNCINTIYNTNIVLKPNYSHSTIVKQYNADFALKTQNFLKVNEIRKAIGFEQLPEDIGEELFINITKQNSQTTNDMLQNENENSKDTIEAKSFFKK